MEQHGSVSGVTYSRAAWPGGRGELQGGSGTGDRRFAAPEWRDSPVFDYRTRSDARHTKYLRDLVEVLPAESDKSRDKMRFLARQITGCSGSVQFCGHQSRNSSSAPSHPGKEHYRRHQQPDLRPGEGPHFDDRRIGLPGQGTTSPTAPGAVVFENQVMQLIRYAPLTAKVGARPLVIVPPCINRFYILDLQPDNSFVPLRGGAGPHRCSWSLKQSHGQNRATRPGTTTPPNTGRSPRCVAKEICRCPGECPGVHWSAGPS